MNVMRYAISSPPVSLRTNVRRLGVARSAIVLVAPIYSIVGITFSSIAITSWGSLAYKSASVMFWPSVNIHFKKSLRAIFLAWSWILDGISNQVKLEIG